MYGDPRSTYLQSNVQTASPARLLVLLVERLELDVRRGLEAQEAGTFDEAHRNLVHAQDILVELASTLRVEDFPAGPGLAQLYSWLHGQLVRANIDRDATITESCLPLITDIASMWREAAQLAAAQQAGGSPLAAAAGL
jgi:flagellar protein FliS